MVMRMDDIRTASHVRERRFPSGHGRTISGPHHASVKEAKQGGVVGMRRSERPYPEAESILRILRKFDKYDIIIMEKIIALNLAQ
jgi:hypothetical protein